MDDGLGLGRRTAARADGFWTGDCISAGTRTPPESPPAFASMFHIKIRLMGRMGFFELSLACSAPAESARGGRSATGCCDRPSQGCGSHHVRLRVVSRDGARERSPAPTHKASERCEKPAGSRAVLVFAEIRRLAAPGARCATGRRRRLGSVVAALYGGR